MACQITSLLRCTADCGWITGHSYVTYGPLLNAATVVVFEGVIIQILLVCLVTQILIDVWNIVSVCSTSRILDSESNIKRKLSTEKYSKSRGTGYYELFYETLFASFTTCSTRKTSISMSRNQNLLVNNSTPYPSLPPNRFVMISIPLLPRSQFKG